MSFCILEASTSYSLRMEVLFSRPRHSRFSLAEIYFSAGGIVFIDLVTWLSSYSMLVLMSDFHRKNRRFYVHSNFSYLQGPREVRATPTL